ncbi:MAG: mevalonate-3-phosphate 5-kinase [Thermoplasmataceae archaeon]
MTDSGKKAKIILIGGIPGVGKSSISGYLARELGIDLVLSGDYLREFVRPVCPDLKVLQVSVYEAWKSYGTESRETVLRGFLDQARVINSGTNAVLKRAIANGESLILETLYFVPSHLEKDVLSRIIPLYIYISDRDVNAERLNERQQFTHFNSPGKRLADQLDRYRIMMSHSLAECETFGIRTFENSDYLKTREQILDYVK